MGVEAVAITDSSTITAGMAGKALIRGVTLYDMTSYIYIYTYTYITYIHIEIDLYIYI